MNRLSMLLFPFVFASISPVQAQEEGLYRNEERKIQFTVPASDYDLRSDPATFRFQWKGALCEISSRDSMVGGVLLYFPAAMKAQKYAQWREKSWKSSPHVKKYDRVHDTLWKKKTGEWLVVEHQMEYEDYDYHYLTLHLAHKRHNFELVLWVSDTIWDDYREALYGILKSVRYGDLPAPAPKAETPAPEKEMTPEPEETPAPEKEMTPEPEETPAPEKEMTPEPEAAPAPEKETTPEPEVAPAKLELYLNREHGFRLLVPPAWDLRNGEFQFDLEGTLLEFENGEKLAGVLGFHKGAIAQEDYAGAFLKGVEKTNESFEDLGTTRTDSGTLLRQCRGKREQTLMRYSLLFATHGDRNYHIVFWTAEKDWDLFEAPLAALLESFIFPTKTGVEKKTSAKTPEKKPEVSHPWRGCNAGSWSEYRTVTEEGASRSEMGMRYHLLEIGEGFYRMRTDVRVADGWVRGEPVRIEFAPGTKEISPADLSKGSELVGVPAGEFLCIWAKRATGEDRSQVWTSDEIPFRMVKSLSLSGGKKTTVTLVGFEKK
jgi:hypothetical protein